MSIRNERDRSRVNEQLLFSEIAWFSLWTVRCNGVQKNYQKKKLKTHGYFTMNMHSPLDSWFSTMNYSRCMTFSTVYGFSFECFSLLLIFFSIFRVRDRFIRCPIDMNWFSNGYMFFRGLMVFCWPLHFGLVIIGKQNYVLQNATELNSNFNKRNICNGQNDRFSTALWILNYKRFLSFFRIKIRCYAYYTLHAINKSIEKKTLAIQIHVKNNYFFQISVDRLVVRRLVLCFYVKFPH